MSLGEVGGRAGLRKGSHQCVEHIVEGAGALARECVNAQSEYLRARHAQLLGELVKRAALGARQVDLDRLRNAVAP